MQTIIVTGISGAGKTQTSMFLEDLGFYCVDNIPLDSMADFLRESAQAGQERVAFVSDIRSLNFNKKYPDLKALSAFKKDLDAEILYLDADDRTLVRRYQQTRRRHPLTEKTSSLEEALKEERRVMDAFRRSADTFIDTTGLKPTELFKRLQRLYGHAFTDQEMQLNILSFGFKYGLPESADFVFDARFLPNPFYIDELKRLSGEEEKVRDYVMSSEVARKYLEHIKSLISIIIPSYLEIDKTVLTVAFGCTGGQHRSVTFAYLLAEYFREQGFSVNIEHRDIKKDRERDKFKYM